MINDKELKAECFWCSNAINLRICKSCERVFCKSCITRINDGNELIDACFMCASFEITKLKSKTSITQDRELMHMLRRFEGMCNSNKLSKFATVVLEDIDSVNVDEFPNFLNVLRSNIYSMKNDFDKLSLMVDQAIEDDNIEAANQVYLPLFKVLTKHHIFNRMGRPSHCLNSKEEISKEINPKKMTEDVSIKFESHVVNTALLSNEYDSANSCSPITVSLEETNIDMVSLSSESDIVTQIKNEATLSETSLFDEPQKSFTLDMSNVVESNKTNLDLTCIKTEAALEISAKTEKKAEKVSKYNRHHVASVIDHHEKSFIIKHAEKVLVPIDLQHPEKKIWSWEKSKGQIVIPFKNRQSTIKNEKSSKNVTLETLSQTLNNSLATDPILKRKILSPESDESSLIVRKRGRPRKYFSDYHLIQSQILQDEHPEVTHQI